MKNRIKTYYEDHKTAIHYVGMFVAISAVHVVVATKLIDGHSIDEIMTQEHNETGAMRMQVTFKNGEKHYFHPIPVD